MRHAKTILLLLKKSIKKFGIHYKFLTRGNKKPVGSLLIAIYVVLKDKRQKIAASKARAVESGFSKKVNLWPQRYYAIKGRLEMHSSLGERTFGWGMIPTGWPSIETWYVTLVHI